MRSGEISKFLHFSNLHCEQVVDIPRELGALNHLGATAHLPFKRCLVGSNGELVLVF